MIHTKPLGSGRATSHPTARRNVRAAHTRIAGVLALCAVVGLAGVILFGCSKGAGANGSQGQGAGPRGRGSTAGAPVPVSVAKVTEEDIPVTVTTFGTVEPYATVAVKPQVTGALQEVHVKEGQYVKKGDLLFVIDPRPYEAALGTAQANLEKDTAQAALAESEFVRTEQLVKSGIGSSSDYDKDKATATSAKAAVNADKQAIEVAKLNLSYCYITSPIDGRTGALLIDQGNAVLANDLPIIQINQTKPVAVRFSLPEQELPRVREYAAAAHLAVEVSIPGGQGRQERGTLVFIDNRVASDTGTIALKADFENGDERLWPGQNVNVTLFLSTIRGALVAPVSAVQESQNGKYAYVVKGDMTVENRPVTAEDVYGDKTVIKSGLTLGETVVTEGHLKLVPGAKISVKAPIAEASPAAAVPSGAARAAASLVPAEQHSVGSSDSSGGTPR